jgi:hypothetical protein
LGYHKSVCRIEKWSGVIVDLAAGEDEIEEAEVPVPGEGGIPQEVKTAVPAERASLVWTFVRAIGADIKVRLVTRMDKIVIDLIPNFAREPEERWQDVRA